MKNVGEGAAVRCPRFPFANRALAEGLFPERNGRRLILKAGSRLRAAAGADGESARKKHPHRVGLRRRSRSRLINRIGSKDSFTGESAPALVARALPRCTPGDGFPASAASNVFLNMACFRHAAQACYGLWVKGVENGSIQLSIWDNIMDERCIRFGTVQRNPALSVLPLHG